MGAACAAGVCDKTDDRRKNSQDQENKVDYSNHRPSAHSIANIPNIDEEEMDQFLVGDSKEKVTTQQNSPEVKRSLVDPDYFSPEELLAYQKLHKREMMDRACRIGPTPRIWKEGDHIGSGSYGEVVMGLDQATGTLMAVKKVHIQSKKGRSHSKIEALEQEITMYENLSHKNIVGYLGSELTSNSFNIFLEYVEGGSLLSIINNFNALPENVVRSYTFQILDGLAYLHSHEVIHRDLKAANVLVDRNGVCKLADFGTAKSVHELNGQSNTLTGTLNWMAPEIIKQLPYGRTADIWSFGCTVYEMATGHPPWQEAELTKYQVMSKVVNSEEDPKFPDSLSESCKDFIRSCMQRDPKKRLNVFALLKHEFLSSVSPSSKHHEKKTSISKRVTEAEGYSPDGFSDRLDVDDDQIFDDSTKNTKKTKLEDTEYYRKMFHRYRTRNIEDGQKENCAPKTDFKIKLQAPVVVDKTGRTKPMNLLFNNDTSQCYDSSRSIKQHERDTDVFNSRAGGEKEFVSSTTKSTRDKHRIQLKREKTNSVESGHNSLSRNLAFNFKNKDFHLRLKTGGTALSNRKPISTKKKGENTEEPSNSDFDFEDGNEEQQEEVIHEVKIVIKKTKKLKTGLLKKPLKQFRSDPKEVDLLGTTLQKEAFEVPKLVINPSETTPVKDLLTQKQPSRKSEVSKEPQHNRGDLYKDFLELDISPKSKDL